MLEKMIHVLLAIVSGLLVLLGATVMLLVGGSPSRAFAESNAVTFPPLEQFVHYTTVERGDSTEHMMASPATLALLKAGSPVPVGSHLVLVDYRNGAVFRYFVSQKIGAGVADWQFQWFHPDRSIKSDENTARCHSCHRSRQESQFMFTLSEAKSFSN